jgi:hypothetical protein
MQGTHSMLGTICNGRFQVQNVMFEGGVSGLLILFNLLLCLIAVCSVSSVW